MTTPIDTFKAALKNRAAVKIIAGIANFDVDNVIAVAKATEAAQAHAIDVSADAAVIRAAKANTQAVVFASSVNPAALAAAVAAGADAVELGNFDALYDQGLFLSAADVLTLAQETKALIPAGVMISITVPGHLTLESQIQLAQDLETLGVDLIQSEGAARVLAETPTIKSLNAAEKATVALRNTAALSNAVSIPVMAASGLNADNVAMAFEKGAAAVGIGSYVNKAASLDSMMERAQAVMANRRHQAVANVG